MKSRRARSKRLRILHLWTLEEAHQAVPYLRSVIGSLREHMLESLNTQRKLELAIQHPQSKERPRLFARHDMREDSRRTQNKFDDALEELNKIDVFLLDAVKGLALIPFRREDDLAWFVFDFFASRSLIGWRYHNDPIEECRPLGLLEGPIANDPVSN